MAGNQLGPAGRQEHGRQALPPYLPDSLCDGHRTGIGVVLVTALLATVTLVTGLLALCRLLAPIFLIVTGPS